MKKLLLLSILAISFSLVSCEKDDDLETTDVEDTEDVIDYRSKEESWD